MSFATFKVLSTHGGYNVGGIKIYEKPDECVVKLLPAVGKDFVIPDDMQYLFGLDETRSFPIIVDGVKIFSSGDYLVFYATGRRLKFQEIVDFLKRFTTLKLIAFSEPGQ